VITKEEALRRLAKIEEYVEEERKQYLKKLEDAEKEVSRLNEEIATKEARLAQLEINIRTLENQVEGFRRFKEALNSLINPNPPPDIVNLVRSEISKMSGGLNIDKVENDLVVNVSRETVTADESTLRGQIGLLIADGEIDDRGLTTRTIAKKLRDMGYSAPAQGLTEELMWFVRNKILSHVQRADGSHVYIVRDKSRVKVVD
jgi:hypothetical protein